MEMHLRCGCHVVQARRKFDRGYGADFALQVFQECRSFLESQISEQNFERQKLDLELGFFLLSLQATKTEERYFNSRMRSDQLIVFGNFERNWFGVAKLKARSEASPQNSKF